MVMRNLVPSPSGVRAIQWTGDNFDVLKTTTLKPIKDNGDGTVSVFPGTSGEEVLKPGDWFVCDYRAALHVISSEEASEWADTGTALDQKREEPIPDEPAPAVPPMASGTIEESPAP